MLRFHGWLLMTWAAVTGLLTSAFLLHVLHVHSLAVRYAAGAAAVYFAGFVFGGWWYAQWWAARKAGAAPDVPERASMQEELEYNQEQDALRKRMDRFNFLGDLAGLGDDPISAVLAILAAIIMVFLVFALIGYMPFIATDALAGYLAEIVIEFVVGAAIVRRILKPRPLDQYWMYAVRNTWLAGLFMIVMFGAAGFAMQQLNPQAATLLQFLRQMV